MLKEMWRALAAARISRRVETPEPPVPFVAELVLQPESQEGLKHNDALSQRLFVA